MCFQRIMKRKNQRKITNTEYHYMEKYQKNQNFQELQHDEKIDSKFIK